MRIVHSHHRVLLHLVVGAEHRILADGAHEVLLLLRGHPLEISGLASHGVCQAIREVRGAGRLHEYVELDLVTLDLLSSHELRCDLGFLARFHSELVAGRVVADDSLVDVLKVEIFFWSLLLLKAFNDGLEWL